MDFPGPAFPPPFLHTFMLEFSGVRESAHANGSTGANPATSSWTTANQARYVPMTLPWAYPVNRVYWGNGTSPTGNMDFGIYTMDGARIYSTGSTAQATSSVPQFVTPSTPFILPPGDYFFALNNDGTTNRGWGVTTGSGTAENMQWGGVFQEAVGAVTLPASATFATASAAGVYLCGVSWVTTTDF